ncbi:YjgN family protein [Rahnella variigena]|uniref:YjgN family protein n=1 Tax=Rahnella variigena TaxID=574964 RepID=UPI000DE9626F|nr:MULTISPECIES: DUF898 family protein [Rahnella]RBQ35291.1 DUF898 domain-containing protein [Rahnella aquatilis]RYJ16753.1 DUF898 domain-containing protein [Rahnella variigena]
MSDNNHYNDNLHQVRFHGKGGEYFAIWLVNALLTIITLGIYSAWATVRRRRYFLGNTEINGDRFDYHAKPIQILKGRLLVIGGIIVFYILAAILPQLALLIALAFLALLPWVVIRSWRYNAIMTSFRGVRFNYHSKVGRAYWTMYLCPILLMLALYIPITAVVLIAVQMASISAILISVVIVVVALVPGVAAVQGIISAMTHDLYINNHFFGNTAFRAELKKSTFIKYSLLAIVLFLPFLIVAFWLMGSFFTTMYQMVAMGAMSDDMAGAMLLSNLFSFLMAFVVLIVGALVVASYQVVAVRNYVLNQTQIGERVKLRSSMKTASYLGLLFTNALIVVFSLGLATPVAHVRAARYMAERTAVVGDLSLPDINAHHDAANTAVAEEVAQAFDLGIGM